MPASTAVRNVVRRGPRSDATANREALIQAAQSVLAQQPNASLVTIAQAAGLSRRALYGHFPDREALIKAVVENGARKFNDIADSTEHADPRVALALLAARLWREASAVRASANIALDDAHVADTARALAPLRQRLRVLTEAGVADGSFRRDLSPAVLAYLVEEAARTTLRGRSSSGDLASGELAAAAGTVVRVVLSIVGLGWVEQVELIEAHPEVLADS